ncbi:hypothetical protein AALP_AA2G000400 [Arabis alpina]|uniref:Late embryogenesis abundant protein LEA-2 subgroup domain-containing protein n=1 Tax=Arabis alpina TaxID=50452 RepID=A0A087HEC1_ARAAL|nr:hypothetical protein AALP_AA2G000400 [Arabis alpina]
MADEDRINLAPSEIYGRSDEEHGPRIWSKKTEKSPGNCLVYTLTIIVIVFAVSLILSLIFLRVSIPEIETNQISTTDLRYSSNSSNSSSYFNATLVSEISIRNSNFGDFEFGNSSLRFVYGDHGVVGETEIGGGRVGAHKTVRLTGIVVQIGSFRLLNSKGLDLDLDLKSGFLELKSVAEITGSVKVLGKKRWKLSVMSCTMRLNLTNRFIQNLLCD